jgi:cytidylate kinase
MDGRDIGTVIIPDAELKVFVDADVNERARRRCEELQRKGEHVLVQEIRQDLVERDHRDRNRAIAPLKQAEDARLLDTTHLTIPEGIKQIVGWVELVS